MSPISVTAALFALVGKCVFRKIYRKLSLIRHRHIILDTSSATDMLLIISISAIYRDIFDISTQLYFAAYLPECSGKQPNSGPRHRQDRQTDRQTDRAMCDERTDGQTYDQQLSLCMRPATQSRNASSTAQRIRRGN